MKLVYQNTISRLYEKIIGNLSNVHTQDLNDFIYSAQMKGLHQFHIILQSTYMKFSYTRHIPSYTLQQCTYGLFDDCVGKVVCCIGTTAGHPELGS